MTVTPEHFEVCTSSCDPTVFYICFWLRAGCSQEPFRPLERKPRRVAKAMAGCDTEERLPDVLRMGLR